MGKLQLVTAALACCCWFALHFAVVFTNLPKSGDSRSQYEWYHTIAYPILFALAVAALGSVSSPWNPHSLVDSVFAYHVISAQVGFFAAGLLLAVFTNFRRIYASLAHHLLSAATYSTLLVAGRFPVVLLWVLCVQVTGVFFHPARLLFLPPEAWPRVARSLESVHLVLFFGCRVFGYAIFTGVFLWRDARDPIYDHVLWEITKYSLLGGYAFVHVAWARDAVRYWYRRRRAASTVE